MRARSALFTLFGDVVRRTGGEAWLSTLTGCMQALGFTPEATRTALHRMTAEGWVEPRRAGRYAAYRLTVRGVDRLDQAAARIYRLRAGDWDGRWRILVCPPAGRSAEAARALAWLGFGRLSGDVWISPHHQGEQGAALLAEHGLDAEPVTFVSEPDGDRDGGDQRIVARAWDLRELRAAHAAFLRRWRDARAPDSDRAAFTTRIVLVHHWRSFLFLDPGLPVALLPDDWLGDDAARCFRSRYEAVDAAAWRFHDALAAAAPAPPARARPDLSPFPVELSDLQVRTPA